MDGWWVDDGGCMDSGWMNGGWVDGRWMDGRWMVDGWWMNGWMMDRSVSQCYHLHPFQTAQNHCIRVSVDLLTSVSFVSPPHQTCCSTAVPVPFRPLSPDCNLPAALPLFTSCAQGLSLMDPSLIYPRWHGAAHPSHLLRPSGPVQAHHIRPLPRGLSSSADS